MGSPHVGILLLAAASALAAALACLLTERVHAGLSEAADLEGLDALERGAAPEGWLEGFEWAAGRGDVSERARGRAVEVGLSLPAPPARAAQVPPPWASAAALGAAAALLRVSRAALPGTAQAAALVAGCSLLAAVAVGDALHHEVYRPVLAAGTCLVALSYADPSQAPAALAAAAIGALAAAVLRAAAEGSMGRGDVWVWGAVCGLMWLASADGAAVGPALAASGLCAAVLALDPEHPGRLPGAAVALCAALCAL